jgi:hypothetical protein
MDLGRDNKICNVSRVAWAMWGWVAYGLYDENVMRILIIKMRLWRGLVLEGAIFSAALL